MNNNQQQKINPKRKAVASFALAIIAILLPLIIMGVVLLCASSVKKEPERCGFILGIPFLISFFLAPIFAIIGLVLGIYGLKSAKKNLAIIGIGLSIIILIIFSSVILLYSGYFDFIIRMFY